MKSEHRHELETNWLAKRLNVMIERGRPYASTVLGIAVAVVLVMVVWSIVAGSSSGRQSEAWNEFNQAVVEPQPDVERLRALAEEHPNTKIQQLADVTWADSQVWLAAHNYLYDRAGAMDALEKASSRYQSVIETSKDARVLNRARLGMARVHEIRGELDKAREEYLKVTGGIAKYAEEQAKRLATPESKETYAWLAKAEPTRPRSTSGLGGPASNPDFSAADLALPGDSPAGVTPTATPGESESLEKLLEGLNLDFGAIDETNDRYQLPNGTPGQPASPPAQNRMPEQGEGAPAQGQAPAPPANEPPSQSDAAPAQRSTSTDSSGDSSTGSQTDNANADADQPE
jgi:hypothetical protein